MQPQIFHVVHGRRFLTLSRNVRTWILLKEPRPLENTHDFHRLSKCQSQPTTVPRKTTPTSTINQPQTSVTTNNSPRDYTNTDDQPTTNVSHNQQQSSGLRQHGRSTKHKRQSQSTTVLLGITPTQMINQPQTSVTTNNSIRDYTSTDDQPTTNVSYNQQQSLSGLHQHGRLTNRKRQSQLTTVLVRTTQTRMINQPQTSATTNNSPRDYANTDDQPNTNVSHNQQQSFSGLHQHR